MSSNCYIVVDEESKHCLCIDPASEKSEREIKYIEENTLTLDYILLTHEHTDHNWGVNSLRESFSKTKLVCSEQCNKFVKKTNRAYFLFYYDNPDYLYEIAPADVLIKEDRGLVWGKNKIHFVLTPGHSYGSMCINVEGMLYTGDTIMPFKPYFNGRDSNKEDWINSIAKINKIYPQKLVLFPGHGDCITLEQWNKQYYIQ